MPKRKNSDYTDCEELSRKLKKIERKLKKARRRERHSSYSSSDDNLPGVSHNKEYPEVSPEDYEENSGADSHTRTTVKSTSTVPEHTDIIQPHHTLPESALESAPGQPDLDVQTTELAPAPQIDSDILSILGEDPSIPKVLGKEIVPALAVRLAHMTTSGLTSELQKELRNKYAVPSNCLLIGAPMINPEIKAAVTLPVLRRDEAIEVKQKQLATALSCITEAITPFISKEKDDANQLKLLMDALRILCDLQHKLTVSRRSLLLSDLKKDLKDQIKSRKVDSYLFGDNLSDYIKTTKAVSRSGAELKLNRPKPTPQNKPGSVGPAKKTYPAKFQHLNWKTPPPGRSATGTQRPREAAARRNQPAETSRMSSQQGRRARY